jgi:hypothetical protein
MADSTVTVPRPGPDEVLMLVCGADGAICWTTWPRDIVADGDFAAQLVPFLDDAQQTLRDAGAG